MGEKSTPKRPRGRPRKLTSDVLIKFEVPEAQAAYLQLLATKFGWGRGINDVAAAIVLSQIMELQKRGFHETKMPSAEHD